MGYMDFYENVKVLAKSNKVIIEYVVKQAGLTLGSYNGYKRHKNLPRADEAVEIAKTLGTTVEYLVTGKEIDGFSQEIISIAQKIAGLDHRDRQDILDFIDIKLKKEKKGRKPMEALSVMEPEPAYMPDISSIFVHEEVKDNVIFLEWGVIEIPLLGSTAAGQPIDFGDIDPDPLTRPWAADLIIGDPKNYYCVLVHGTSMTEADIKDGDHALLRHTNKPRNGEIMLVRHEDSSTLKRIKIVEGKNGQEETWICWEDGSKNKVKLAGDEYEIQGVLVAIERKPMR